MTTAQEIEFNDEDRSRRPTKAVVGSHRESYNSAMRILVTNDDGILAPPVTGRVVALAFAGAVQDRHVYISGDDAVRTARVDFVLREDRRGHDHRGNRRHNPT